MEKKEERIKAITKLYYSNPDVQACLLEFAREREVIPRYFEVFGKRPDTLQYPSDIIGLVNKGATSFHASEEIWYDPLKIDSNMSLSEINELRKGWDLLLDIDSPFLDCSKIALKLILKKLEYYGIKNYGIKFSGSKGFHIIVSGEAFPEEFEGMKKKEMFPEWPRAIAQYIANIIRKEYNYEVGKIISENEIVKRTHLKKEDLGNIFYCRKCNKQALKGIKVKFKCDTCGTEIERKNFKLTNRRLKCVNEKCAGILEIIDKIDYYYCQYDKDPDNQNLQLSSDKYPEEFEEIRGINAEKIAGLDLVLVAPRHLFRMPYSLHEKTALASVVLFKNEIDNFNPKDADPLKVKIESFMPKSDSREAEKLLAAALIWKKKQNQTEDLIIKKKYENYKDENFENKNITEDMFPEPIKKLLRGVSDGKKRGLFILITFFRALNFSAKYIDEKIKEWNKKNDPPLKEGYIRNQIEWHLRQKKKIMPPNYDNYSFYADIGLLDKKPSVKNPLVEVKRKLRESNSEKYNH